MSLPCRERGTFQARNQSINQSSFLEYDFPRKVERLEYKKKNSRLRIAALKLKC
jgi:hypothetical protein